MKKNYIEPKTSFAVCDETELICVSLPSIEIDDTPATGGEVEAPVRIDLGEDDEPLWD